MNSSSQAREYRLRRLTEKVGEVASGSAVLPVSRSFFRLTRIRIPTSSKRFVEADEVGDDVGIADGELVLLVEEGALSVENGEEVFDAGFVLVIGQLDGCL